MGYNKFAASDIVLRCLIRLPGCRDNVPLCRAVSCEINPKRIYMDKFSKIFMLMLFISTASFVHGVEKIIMDWNSEVGETKMLWISASAEKEFSVNYGDGSDAEIITGTGGGIANLLTLSHTYAAAGNYTVTITASSDDCHFTDIDSYGSGITSLDASDLPGLTYISVAESPVTTLNLSGSTSLKEVYCMGTRLEELDLHGMDRLEKLFVQTDDATKKGTLKKLNLNGCSSLVDVYAFNNSLESLDVQGCSSLAHLLCEMNNLSSLDASGLASLNDLRCNHNRIEELNVEGCADLRQLWCYENEIKSLDVSGFALLQRLEAYNNELVSLNAAGCSSLLYLEANGNTLESLDVSGCTAMEMLNCANNNLVGLDVRGLGALQELRAYSNQLETLQVEGLSNLMILHCFDNKIETISLEGLSNIESIDANTNELVSFDLTPVASLNELRIYGNHLSLSQLYPAKTIVKFDDYRQLGEQNLLPSEAVVGEDIDLSSEIEFDGVMTQFAVSKGEAMADAGDYDINDGVLKFLKPGEYNVEMTNSAIPSFEYQPLKVTATYSVSEAASIDGVMSEGDAVVSIFNVSGVEVFRGIECEMPQLAPGIYLFRYDDGKTEKKDIK